ncbi:MFS transporter [Phenylobacterium sp. LjRoot225]|uniref:MFS transporter n=1 Tax=Phenylobacterium sp. LjRoot225 TaxID=3342285 RepID=UPI003ECE30EF
MPGFVSPRWLTFSALSLLFFVVTAGAFSSLGVVLPAMVSEMHWTWTEAGVGYTVLGVACGLASFMPAVLIRLAGVRGTMFVGTVALVTGFGAMAVTHSVAMYLAATVLIGMAFALVSTVPGTHVLTDLFEKRAFVIGAYFTIGSLGGVAGPMIYVAVHALSHGWRLYWVTFVALAAIAGVAAILTTPGRRDESRHKTEVPEHPGPAEVIEGLKDWTVRRALRTWQFYVIVGGYTTYLLVNTTAHGFGVQHLTERGVSPQAAAAMLSLEALVGSVIAVFGGMLGEKLSPKVLMIVSLAALTLGMAGLAEARGWGLMSVFVVGVGLGFGLCFVASTMLLFNYFGRGPNLELFSIMCMISTVAAAGPAFGGWARDTLGSFSQMFLLCAGVTGLLLFATLFLSPPLRRPAAAAEFLGEPAE